MTASSRVLTSWTVVILVSIALRHTQAQETPPRGGVRVVEPAPRASGAESFEEKTLRLLQTRLDVVYRGTLFEGLDAIGRATGVRIEVGAECAKALKIDKTTRVDWNLRGCTARATLDRFLAKLARFRLSIEWLPIDGRIVLLAKTADDTPLLRNVLNTTALLRAAGSREYAESLRRELPELLADTVQPTAWQNVGGHCRIEPRGTGGSQSFVLTATPSVWRDVVALLKTIDNAAEVKSPASVIPFIEENADVLNVIEKPVTLDAHNVPFAHVVRGIERQIGVPINLDRQALVDYGIKPNRPVTLRCSDLSASDAIGRISSGAKWMCLGGSLLITSPHAYEDRTTIGVFDIHDLVRTESGGEDVDAFIVAITTTVRPETWDDVGGAGAIAPLHLEQHTLLVISQTQEALEEIKTLLGWIREARRKRNPVLRLEAPGRAAILKSLEQESRLHFEQTPLREALATISAGAQIDIYFDQVVLDEAGIGLDAPVSLDRGTYSARQALGRILGPCGLKYIIEYGGLMVTTSECETERLDIAVYDVSDFVTTEHAWGYSEALIECVTSTLEPTMWDDCGGPGSIAPLFVRGRTFLVVRHTAGRLDTLTAFFDALRKAGSGKITSLILEDKEDARVRKALQRRIAWSFDKTPLPKAAEKIAADLGVDLYVDRRGLKRADIDPDSLRVSLPGRTLDAPEALTRLLERQGLGFSIEGGSLVITTKDGARYPQKIAIYRMTGPRGKEWGRVDETIAGILDGIEPETWDSVGGLGVVSPIVFPDDDWVLVVSNEDRVLFKVDRYMKK